MKKRLKPYSLLFYLLALITFFFAGIIFVKITGAAKDQGLAGGAIVLGYGVFGASIGLCLSLITVTKIKRVLIIKINGLLTLIIITSITYFILNYQKRQQKKLEQDPQKREQTTPKKTTPNVAVKPIKQLAILTNVEKEIQTEIDMGLGMFAPNFYENRTLYFYGNLTTGKSAQEHMPTDSITFKQRESGGFDIVTAPPWLVPDHLKLDYDLLYFKVKSISHDFFEVIVNTTNNQTAFIDRSAGKIRYWPEFLLSVHSVEFSDHSKNNVYSRPFDSAGVIETTYSFMRPIKIENEWMYVALQNDAFNEVAKGWIRWHKNGKLLIIYSLLS